MWTLRKTILYVMFFIIGILILRVFFFEIYVIHQNSMKNTLKNGSRVLLLKNYYTIQQNDILIFKNEKENLIKRCVALPGDKINIVNGIIYVNNFMMATPPKAILDDGFDNIIIEAELYYTYNKNWTANNFGTYLVPRKGLKIMLTNENISLYKKLILKEIESTSGNHENWQNLPYYIFKNDYYFFVGDNRGESVDSRAFGPIKIEDIRGKIILN